MNKLLIVNTRYDIYNRNTWSGIPFSILREMKKYFEVDTFTIKLKKNIQEKIHKGIRKFILRKNYLDDHNDLHTKRASAVMQQYLNDHAGTYDAIFVMGTAPIGYIQTDIPIVYFNDAVISSMFDYYYYNISERDKAVANRCQKRALDNASAVVLTSEWAKNAAVRDYSINADKVRVIHFGANVEVHEFKHRDHEGINLLFVGKDWIRKGGSIAVKIVDALNELDKERKYTLHLVGCTPTETITSQNVVSYGYIDRNNKEEKNKLELLRAQSDFFLMPTLAECAGIVFCEACAYSTPSITFDTGGVGDYVKNGFNGYRMPLNSSPEEFAIKIKEILDTPGKLKEMQENARRLYEDDLNWEVFGKNLAEVLHEQISKNRN